MSRGRQVGGQLLGCEGISGPPGPRMLRGQGMNQRQARSELFSRAGGPSAPAPGPSRTIYDDETARSIEAHSNSMQTELHQKVLALQSVRIGRVGACAGRMCPALPSNTCDCSTFSDFRCRAGACRPVVLRIVQNSGRACVSCPLPVPQQPAHSPTERVVSVFCHVSRSRGACTVRSRHTMRC